MTLQDLAHKIEAHFSLEELAGLCFELDTVKYENLDGTTLKDKVRNLVEHCKRHGEINELVTQCKKLRPKIDWPALLATETENEIIVVKIFMLQDEKPFANQPGRYSNHLKFTLTNTEHQVIQSLKLTIDFPKLENLIKNDKFHRFHQNVNRIDFSIQEVDDIYHIVFQFENLLPGDSIKLERACLNYSMEVPDKEKWLNIVKNSKLKLLWKLFSSISPPSEGEIDISELYIDNIKGGEFP